MPKYLFVVHNRQDSSMAIAHELPSLAAARSEAIHALADLASDELPNDGDQQSFWVRVQDEEGHELLVASLEFKLFDLKSRAAVPTTKSQE